MADVEKLIKEETKLAREGKIEAAQEWNKALQAGKNPFTDEELEKLK
ncbi:MAG: hypothetical protein F6K40_12065 [Okeania sp. SIO3I5]|nr:hypothetical protein [Okeania sp. SIO3I5]NEQ36966.1 hypothetical protein [Okeania sp. SIO3I5]